MTNAGFIPVKNPSAVFLEQDMNQASGSVVSCIIEGTRPFLVENSGASYQNRVWLSAKKSFWF